MLDALGDVADVFPLSDGKEETDETPEAPEKYGEYWL